MVASILEQTCDSRANQYYTVSARGGVCFIKLKSCVIYNVLCYSSHWSSEPNFLGSYAYKTIRGDELAASRSDLAAPVLNAGGQPVVQFAGEATELSHFATVHGAVESGWREANRLIDLYK